MKFKDMKLKNNAFDLAMSFNSLSFCDREYFDTFLNMIIDSIKKDGSFVGNFFSVNDDWAKTRADEMTFPTREEIERYFDGKFDSVIIPKDKEYDEKKEKNGKKFIKHWHIITVIAKNKK